MDELPSTGSVTTIIPTRQDVRALARLDDRESTKLSPQARRERRRRRNKVAKQARKRNR